MTGAQRDFYGSQTMGAHTNAKPVIHLCQVEMIQHHNVGPDPRILDIGSGVGIGGALIRSAIGSGHLVSVDVSVESLRAIVQNGGSAVMADAEGHLLPFRDDSFDLVIFDEVIEHLVDTDSIVEEIRRVLKPDGLLLMSTPNLAAWFNRLALLIGVQPAFSEVSRVGVFGRPGVGLVGHLRLFTRRALVQFLRAHQYELIEIRGVVFPELPRPLRVLDKLFAKRSALAGGLVCLAKPIVAPK